MYCSIDRRRSEYTSRRPGFTSLPGWKSRVYIPDYNRCPYFDAGTTPRQRDRELQPGGNEDASKWPWGLLEPRWIPIEHLLPRGVTVTECFRPQAETVSYDSTESCRSLYSTCIHESFGAVFATRQCKLAS